MNIPAAVHARRLARAKRQGRGEGTLVGFGAGLLVALAVSDWLPILWVAAP